MVDHFLSFFKFAGSSCADVARPGRRLAGIHQSQGMLTEPSHIQQLAIWPVKP